MVFLITGASHTGKTLLAQRLLERIHVPYLSVDHLKMGLIRSGQTALTPEDDDALTVYLWPILREIIKTAVENKQDLIVEGCYVPFDWRQDLEERYLSSVSFLCIAMTGRYIEQHYDEIVAHESAIEARQTDDCTLESLKADNKKSIDGFQHCGEPVTLIDSDYDLTMETLVSRLEAFFQAKEERN